MEDRGGIAWGWAYYLDVDKMAQFAYRKVRRSIHKQTQKLADSRKLTRTRSRLVGYGHAGIAYLNFTDVVGRESRQQHHVDA